MTWFDLVTGTLRRRGAVGRILSGDVPPSQLADTDIAGAADAALAIRFDRFSDGRGFTTARHLREVLGFTGLLVAKGHIIPDQADYLRRCGFSHAEIDLSAARQWRRSLAMAPPAMQRVLGSPRGRSLLANRPGRGPKRRD